jgi:putative intracellular protease/amidase
MKVLIFLSEHGYWGEEFVGPYEVLTKKGIDYDFWTPTGRVPHALPPSMSTGFQDPPLGKTVTSSDAAKKVKDIDDCAAGRKIRIPHRDE